MKIVYVVGLRVRMPAAPRCLLPASGVRNAAHHGAEE